MVGVFTQLEHIEHNIGACLTQPCNDDRMYLVKLVRKGISVVIVLLELRK